MKVNDTYPVNIAGQHVANATVKEIGEGTVTLLVPATIVVMATRTEISAPEHQESSVEVLGLEETGAPETPVENTSPVVEEPSDNTTPPAVDPAPEAVVESAPVVEEKPVE